MPKSHTSTTRLAETKALTLRLPPELYASGQQMARERRISLNTLLQESLREQVRAQQKQRLFEAFTLLADDPSETDVEFALAAQAEVALTSTDTSLLEEEAA